MILRMTFFAHCKRNGFLLFAVMCTCLLCGHCGMHRYTTAELLKKTGMSCPARYDDILRPLDSTLAVVCKQIFFLKNDIAGLKDKLWDVGTNQRIMKIDDRIDTLRKEVSALSTMRKEIINGICRIFPAYKEPQIVAYKGNQKPYQKITEPVILITQQDQSEYLQARAKEEKKSQTIVYRHLIVLAMKQYYELPDSLKPAIQVVGAQLPFRQ